MHPWLTYKIRSCQSYVRQAERGLVWNVHLRPENEGNPAD